MQSDPPWHHLPGNPRAFFGLADTATREDLKSAYSQWIRRYKPDKSPNEFKKIRAAFDAVDRELRSGEGSSQSSVEKRSPADGTLRMQRDASREIPTSQLDRGTEPATPSGEPQADDREPALTPRAASYLRIGTTEPSAWYEELERQTNKSPYDYFVLAALADIVPGADQSFASWIAEGALAHPRDPHLASLFHALLNDKHLACDEIQALLLRIARGSTPSQFYVTTDGLWKQFVIASPWEDVVATLQNCERELMARGHAGRLPFMIAMMRKAMWRAPIEWLQERKRMVEESHEGLQDELEYEHEMNCKLLLLREKHLARLQGGPYGRKIFAAIQTFCEESESRAIQAVCQCQLEILANSREFFSEFDYAPGEETEWAQAWTWISWFTLSKLATQESPGEQQWILQNIYDTMKAFDAQFPRSVDQLTGLMNIVASVVYLFTSLFLIMVMVLVASLTSMSILGLNSQAYLAITMGTMLVGLLMSLLFLRKASKKWQSNVIHPFIRKRVTRNYCKFWRGKLAFLMQRLMCPYHFLMGSVQQISNTPGSGIGVSKWLMQLMPNDLGLMLYCAAVPFAR